MTVRVWHYENVVELDEVILPARAKMLTVAYEEFVASGLGGDELTSGIYSLALLLSTDDQFTSEQALRDAVLHGFHILWLNVSREYKPLTRILVESWAIPVPSHLIVQEDGLYRLAV